MSWACVFWSFSRSTSRQNITASLMTFDRLPVEKVRQDLRARGDEAQTVRREAELDTEGLTAHADDLVDQHGV